MHRLNTKKWFDKATVRTMPHIELEGDFDWRYPKEMKPLLAHPAIVGLPESAYRYLCVQLFYKYMHDICLTETDVVSRVALSIAYQSSAIRFPAEVAAEAFTIVIDEAFHSYIARLFSLEIERVTQIEPLPLPKENQLMRAGRCVANANAPQITAIADLLCCCISESTFTKEIFEASRLKGYDPAFETLMAEHLRDEGRHYGYFKSILKYFWETASAAQHEIAIDLLPGILKNYFSAEIDAAFERHVLSVAGMPQAEASRLIEDIYGNQEVNPNHPRLQNALEFLRGTGVLNDSRVVWRLAEEGLMLRETGAPMALA